MFLFFFFPSLPYFKHHTHPNKAGLSRLMQASNQLPTTQDRARRGLVKVLVLVSTGMEKAQYPVRRWPSREKSSTVGYGCRHWDAINLLYYGVPNKNKNNNTCARTGIEASPFHVPKRGFHPFPIHYRDYRAADACLSSLYPILFILLVLLCNGGTGPVGCYHRYHIPFYHTVARFPTWTDYIRLGMVYQAKPGC